MLNRNALLRAETHMYLTLFFYKFNFGQPESHLNKKLKQNLNQDELSKIDSSESISLLVHE